jgi:hypothetical protein
MGHSDASFEMIVPRSKVSLSPSCGSIITLGDGRLLWVWAQGHAEGLPVMHNLSSDGGRTWTDPTPLRLENGAEFSGVLCPSQVRLSDGRLGMTLTSSTVKGDHGLDNIYAQTFHVSADEGKTWSEGVPVNLHTRHAQGESPAVDGLIRLSDGRLVQPNQKTVGPTPTVEHAKLCRLLGQDFTNPFAYNLAFGFVYYSDDEGLTWERSRNEAVAAIDRGLGGLYGMGEPQVAELADGRLLMLGRTSLGQVFRSYSPDRGESWLEAEPTGLPNRGPICMERIPDSDDLLAICNQVSPWEGLVGVYRHRLTCAVSQDGGQSWGHRKNLESLDDVSCIETPPVQLYLAGPICQPLDRVRYHRAPAPLRMDHPYCAFHEGNVIFVYGCGALGLRAVVEKTYGMNYEELGARFGFEPHPSNPNKLLGTNKLRIEPIRWLYE